MLNNIDLKKTSRLIFATLILTMLFVFSAGAATRNAEIRTINKKQVLHLRKGVTEWIPASKTTTYKTSNAKVVAVNSNGFVKGLKVGTATLKGYSKKTKKLTQTINVTVYDTSAKAVSNKILALKKKYPEGTTFTDNKPYSYSKPYRSNIILPKQGTLCGTGCAGFAYIASDYAYGCIRAKSVKSKQVAVGDIIVFKRSTYTRTVGSQKCYWTNFEGHQAIVTKIANGKVYTAEGNCGGKVSWKQWYTTAEIKKYIKEYIYRY